ncbi:hypothetical protein TA3x_001543 [Tundrisphaera sp. TA3]|uniref:hypothetical protein n=1 Tax=Tundrisphaera sp. TA3 TaxID=3435775 RepID=UPI003EB8164F
MRRRENYVRKYGEEFGSLYYHTLQSHAAHAGVAARLRRKLDILTGKVPPPSPRLLAEEPMPLFDGFESPEVAAV